MKHKKYLSLGLVIIVAFFVVVQNQSDKKEVPSGHPISDSEDSEDPLEEAFGIFESLSDTFESLSTKPEIYSTQVSSYEERYSLYMYRDEVLIAAKDPETNLWNLYQKNNEGELVVIAERLVEDCCGGGMPVVQEYDLPFLAKVTGLSGDVCSHQRQELIVDFRDEIGLYRMFEESNSCSMVSEASFRRSDSEEVFAFEPIFSRECLTKEDLGEPVDLIGLRAKSELHEYEVFFDDIVSGSCISDPALSVPSVSEAVRSIGIGYTLQDQSVDRADISVDTYEFVRQEVKNIRVQFDLEKGFLRI